jgi:hypothetical protein
MRDKSLLIAVPVVVLLSAATAYGLVFWAPWFGAKYFGGMEFEYIDTSTLYDVRELAQRQPKEVQATVTELFEELVGKSDAELYILRSLSDVCIAEFSCRGISSTVVKPFVEAALAHKTARETAAASAGSLNTARLSLAVAFAAFLVSIFGLFVKRRA